MNQRLEEIAESVDYGVTASAANLPIGPKFLRITDIQDGRVDWNSVPYCECDKRESEASRLKAGDIVFARTGATTGKSYLINQCPEDTVFASYLIRVRLKKIADSNYVGHFFQSTDYWKQITKGARGAAQPGVNASTLKQLEIPLPPLAEQKRIAAILDAADALRTKRRESLAQLDALLQSTFLTLFGDPVTNPMGWQELEFEQIVESTKLGLVRGSSEFGWDMPVPYVRMDAISNDGRFLPEKVQRTNASKAEIEAYGLQSGDFLLNTRNSKELVGKITVFRGPPGWTFNNNIIRIRFRKDVEPDVISTQFRFSRVQQALEQRKAGTTSVFAIYWKELKSLPVLVPPLPLQQKFAAIVESVERQKAAQRAHLAELDALFAALQHRAFRGEL